MKFKFLKEVSAGLLLIASTSANAVIIDNGSYTTVDGVDWLDMSFTDGKSYNDVLSLISIGQALEGWSVAAFDSVAGLHNSFGYTVTPSTTSGAYNNGNTGYSEIKDLIGATMGTAPYSAWTLAYVAELNGSATQQRTVQSGEYYSIAADFWRGDSWGFDQAVADDRIGTWLNRPGVTIPEPTTFALFALGLMGLASRRFKKQA
jgi:hypothetical protein